MVLRSDAPTLLVLSIVCGISVYLGRRSLDTVRPPVAAVDIYALIVDSTPITVPVFAGDQRAVWPTTADEAVAR